MFSCVWLPHSLSHTQIPTLKMHINSGLGLILSCRGMNTLVPSMIPEEWGSLQRHALRELKTERGSLGGHRWTLLLGIQHFIVYLLLFCKTQRRQQTGEYISNLYQKDNWWGDLWDFRRLLALLRRTNSSGFVFLKYFKGCYIERKWKFQMLIKMGEIDCWIMVII